MCGIVGVIGKGEAAPLLVEGLRRLEYRGYDSAGIATLVDGAIERRRAEGKLVNLESALNGEPIAGTLGIGHTRWATHGVPNTTNAHPHATARVAVVHNGIIENFQELKDELEKAGHRFATQTDTEVVPHLVTAYLEEGLSPQEATARALGRLEGAFALGLLFAGEDALLIAARRGSPLAIGYGEGEMYLASDAVALAPLTQRVSYLEEGDWAELRRDGVVIHDASGRTVEREVRTVELSGAASGKGNFRHYMLKEIYEQPTVIGDTLNAYYNPAGHTVRLPPAVEERLASVDEVMIVACGTSSYAGLVAKYWFERLARLPVEVDIASEFRYREAPLRSGSLALLISQSGETADSLAALRFVKDAGVETIGIVNVPESTIAREAEYLLPTHAGPEVGVASTKAFTCQLTVLACLAIALARTRAKIDRAQEAALAQALAEVPSRAAELLNHDASLRALAHDIMHARDVLYVGRGSTYPIALEGALKLKEISYIHAEGFAAGELKHGPIALIDEDVPVIVVAPSGPLFEKTASNVQEIRARGGRVVLLSDAAGIDALGAVAETTIELPAVDPFVAPLLYTIPVQLLAYHVAVLKGTDVDQPRNLAKSVTVE
ncbi:MAG: glutamine--fructose-6-phosphate transaminase (isomerizing) [Proteobacteria bacterium]|nr:glutamine--fructose-6-phosphate transaminase (isomerizing) [Pseudomonadota bacterium]